jgi:hypothetical protein
VPQQCHQHADPVQFIGKGSDYINGLRHWASFLASFSLRPPAGRFEAHKSTGEPWNRGRYAFCESLPEKCP